MITLAILLTDGVFHGAIMRSTDSASFIPVAVLDRRSNTYIEGQDSVRQEAVLLESETWVVSLICVDSGRSDQRHQHMICEFCDRGGRLRLPALLSRADRSLHPGSPSFRILLANSLSEHKLSMFFSSRRA